MRSALTSIPAAQRIKTFTAMRSTSQESDRESEKCEPQGNRHELGNAEEPQLGVRALRDGYEDCQYEDLARLREESHEERDRRYARRHTRGKEQVHEQSQVQQLLESGRPLDKRQVRPGVLQDNRLVDHRELQVRGRVV